MEITIALVLTVFVIGFLFALFLYSAFLVVKELAAIYLGKREANVFIVLFALVALLMIPVGTAIALTSPARQILFFALPSEEQMMGIGMAITGFLFLLPVAYYWLRHWVLIPLIASAFVFAFYLGLIEKYLEIIQSPL